MTNTNMSNDSIELLCNHCGETFSAFLHQMADRNAKVVCPKCGESGERRPAKPEPRATTRKVKKIT
jgi:formylmethanofuran dehydrogenase subunit E